MITAHPVIAVITAIIAALVTLYNKCEWFREGVNRILKAIRDGFFAAWDGIVEFFTETIPNAWNEIYRHCLPIQTQIEGSACSRTWQ